jgi:hypothetical protein
LIPDARRYSRLLFQAFGYRANDSASRHTLAPFIFAFGEFEDSRARAAHPDLWPGLRRRAL